MSPIEQAIENENFEAFQKEFSYFSSNFQQIKNLLQKIYLYQNIRFVEFIDGKISISKEQLAPIIIQVFAYSKKTILPQMFSKIDDQMLRKHMSSSLLERMFFERDDAFFIDFVQHYNIYSFQQIKKMIYFSYKYNKENFFSFLSQSITSNNEFNLYIMLCAYKNKKIHFLNEFIDFHQSKNADFIDDMKLLIQFSNIHKYVNATQFKEFANKVFIRSFSTYLNNTLEQYEHQKITSSKVIKI